jgi:soluble lytic murein transglycosylase-like protein
VPVKDYLNQRMEQEPPAEVLAYADEAADRNAVPRPLFRSVIAQESRWDPNAGSHKGARGYAQLMPITAQDVGVDRTDWRQNLEGGARYLAKQKKRFGRWDQSLAAYNSSPSLASKRGTDWSKYKQETRDYLYQICLRNGGALPPD